METKVNVHALPFDLSFGYLTYLKSFTQVLSGVSLVLPASTLYLFPFVSLAKLFFCWHGSCLFSAILGTGSARNKLLKWRPLTRSFSPLLRLSLPSLLSSGLVYVE